MKVTIIGGPHDGEVYEVDPKGSDYISLPVHHKVSFNKPKMDDTYEIVHYRIRPWLGRHKTFWLAYLQDDPDMIFERLLKRYTDDPKCRLWSI